MKTPLPVLLFSLSSILIAGSCSAATVLYSFDTLQNGEGVYTQSVSANSGFGSASSIARTGTVRATNDAGGEASFTDFQGVTWLGSGSSTTPGHSLNWGGNSTGNTFSLTLDTTGLVDLTMRMAVRSAGTGALLDFGSFSYDIGSGPIAITTGTSGFTAGSAFSVWTADLSSIGAIEGAPSVTFTWTLANIASGASFRVDNLQISADAVPEPSTLAMIAVGGILISLSLRRGSSRQAIQGNQHKYAQKLL